MRLIKRRGETGGREGWGLLRKGRERRRDKKRGEGKEMG